MGGIAFILATLLAYFGAKLITGDTAERRRCWCSFLIVGLGLVGFLDDYIKIVKQRSLGLRAKAKMAGSARRHRLRGAVAAVRRRPRQPPRPRQALVHPDFGWTIGPVLFVIWALFMILAVATA